MAIENKYGIDPLDDAQFIQVMCEALGDIDLNYFKQYIRLQISMFADLHGLEIAQVLDAIFLDKMPDELSAIGNRNTKLYS